MGLFCGSGGHGATQLHMCCQVAIDFWLLQLVTPHTTMHTQSATNAAMQQQLKTVAIYLFFFISCQWYQYRCHWIRIIAVSSVATVLCLKPTVQVRIPCLPQSVTCTFGCAGSVLVEVAKQAKLILLANVFPQSGLWYSQSTCWQSQLQ